MRKKILAVFLTIVLVNASAVCAFAEDDNVSAEETQVTTTVSEKTAEGTSSEITEENTQADVKDLCGLQEKTEYKQLTEEEYQELQEKSNDYGTATYSMADLNYWKSFSSDYYYNKLTEEEKRAWDELEQKCIAAVTGTENLGYIMTDQIYFGGQNPVDIYNFIFLFRYAHPQYYFLSNQAGLQYYDSSQGYFLAIQVYDAFQNGQNRQNITKTFCNKVDSWVAQVKQKSEVLEEQREKVAYDLICDNTTYEFGTYDQSAYSLVCEGKTVCAGYAAVFQMLMNAVGIETVEVTSYNHAWNLTNIHGTWYEVDTTWADGADGYISYNYYNKSEDTISSQGYDSSHIADAFLDSYQPEAKYDSLSTAWYNSPYFENGNYTWFIVNDNESLDGGYLATPVQTKNGVRYDAAPSSVGNGENLYTTVYLKQDVSASVKANDVQGLKLGGRAADALRLNWTRDASMSGYIVEQNKNGKWVRIARIGNGTTNTWRVEELTPSTSYQFRVRTFTFAGTTPVYGNYAYVNGKTNPATVSGIKIGGRAGDALRLNWNKDSKASGYIIEQYKGGGWTRIARIGSNATTTYRVEKLTPSTTYKFRIKAFGFDGNTALYSNYTYVSGKTNPAVISGLKIGGTAKDALRLNWNRDGKASGYIVEEYKNNKWMRIARIGSNATTTYRAEGLKSKTTYKFRVQAFGFEGSVPLYGSYSYISGVTR